MGRYWLLNQHGSDGPTALVETDGRMQIVGVLSFGPGITELEDQQKVWDDVVGQLAPTLKPLADASSMVVEGVAPHVDLKRSGHGGTASRRAGRASSGGPSWAGGRSGGGPSRKGSRGDR